MSMTRQAAVTHATKLTEEVLRRRATKDVREPVAAAFGKALAMTPPGSAHRKVLAGAIQKERWQDRSAAERAAWFLAVKGVTPTEAAVAARLGQLADRSVRAEERRAARDAALLPGGIDGGAVAAFVASVWESTGAGPTWSEVCRAGGFPQAAIDMIVRRLVDEKWLAVGAEPRSLRPGPRWEEEL